MAQKSICIACGNELSGRSDKKYCDEHCKSAYQYKNAANGSEALYRKIDKQLRLNRKLLKGYNRAGKATVRASELLSEGFDPKYFTHYWKNQKGDVYLFVYEFGFLKRKENGRDKFVLVKWQDYMNVSSKINS